MAGEGRAFTGDAFQRHPAAVQLDQSLDQGHAEPGPAPFAPDEAVEDVGLDVIGEAAPRVGHGQLDLRPLAMGVDAHGAALGRVVQGRIHQVVQHLHQPALVGPHRAAVVHHLADGQIDAQIRRRAGGARNHLVQESRQIDIA